MSKADLTVIPLFKTLPPQEIKRLEAVLEIRAFENGAWLFKEGDRGDSFFVILSGQVNIIKASGSTEESILGVRGPGEFIGEVGLLNPDGIRTASARTGADSQLLVVKYDDMTDLIGKYPRLAYELASVLSARMTAAQDQNVQTIQEKNKKLQQAYDELKEAQAQLIQKELLEKELELAHKIQSSILPPTLPKFEGYDFGCLMNPAKAVGGDFYGFFPLDADRVAIVVGDVTDKGVPAALFMAQTYSLLLAFSSAENTPKEIVQRVNSTLRKMNAADMFATLIYGILDKKNSTFNYVRAGHDLPILAVPSGDAKFIESNGGPPIGIWDNLTIIESDLTIPQNGMLILYSDGVVDSQNPEQENFSRTRLQKIVQDMDLQISAQQVCWTIFEKIEAHQAGQTQFDDITLLVIKRLT